MKPRNPTSLSVPVGFEVIGVGHVLRAKCECDFDSGDFFRAAGC